MRNFYRRFALRERTMRSHAAVDAAVGSFADKGEYRQYLRGMWAFRAPIEAGMADLSWPQDFGGWRPLAVAELIRADMDDLGMPSEPRPPAAAAPDPADLAALLGTLYVLEGSSLGARVLQRRAAALGYDGAFAARHLARQTADPASWATFLALLEAAPIDIERAADAADATFAAALDAFTRYSHVDA